MSNKYTDRIKNIRRTKDPKKVVRKAAALLEKEPHRWTKGQWIVSPTGETFDPQDYFGESCDIGGVCKVCLEGALLIYSKDDDTYYAAKDLVLDALRKLHPRTGRSLYAFNDSRSAKRGAATVTEVLKEAAK